MKQLLSLFLFLLPCIALAQYPSNGNQKITLGEQTSADGLIWRGVAATDTVRKPSIDTMAYMVLDTTTNIIWHYKKAISNAWLRVGGSITSGLTGTLPVANGGTNRTTMPAGYILHGDGTSVDTSGQLFWDRSSNRLGIGTTTPGYQFQVKGTDATIIVSSNDDTAEFRLNAQSGLAIFETTTNTDIRIRAGSDEKMRIVNNGDIRIFGLANASNPVNVQVDVNGVLIRSSSIELKDNVQNLPYGLNDLLLLKPYKFNYKDKYKFGEGYDIGFIAEDVNDIVPEAVGTGVNSDIFMDSVKLIPILTKAIQEQQVLIKALEQRIINLENK
jgi:hypothetical protein